MVKNATAYVEICKNMQIIAEFSQMSIFQHMSVVFAGSSNWKMSW